MRILFISDRGKGGIKNHVKCILECLRGVEGVETYCIGEDEPFAGKSGHDFAEWKQIRRVIKTFKPDVIHFHTIPFFMGLYVKLFSRRPTIVSIHTGFYGDLSFRDRLLVFKSLFLQWLISPAYVLAVSFSTLDAHRKLNKKKDIRYEVIFNSVRIPDEKRNAVDNERQIVGLVGRNVDAKDWPSFASVTKKLLRSVENVEVWAVGVSKEEAEISLGDLARHISWKGFQPNGREWIGKMDLVLLTSRNEEMPTVVLEAFSVQTPVCGYIPAGGMSDILELSNGALKEVFVKVRDPMRLAGIANRLLCDESLRQRVVEDGWQIVTRYFDADINTRKMLKVYERSLHHDEE